MAVTWYKNQFWNQQCQVIQVSLCTHPLDAGAHQLVDLWGSAAAEATKGT
jgi:hypothetical protein